MNMNSIKRIGDANYAILLRFELVDTGGVSPTARTPRNENVFKTILEKVTRTSFPNR
jgi:hypothetical protein